ncbi:hypothetical protein LUZ60_017217 [Juncus effusus]|nr:hypothetical protein LUZ60_017217 [Juncus effusus]
MGNRVCGFRRRGVEERLTRPSERLINQQADVDYKRVRHLIRSGKLAPFYDACEDQGSGCMDLEECPICFLYYPSLNRSKCCSKGICTECFLQMMPSDTSRPVHCPFCKANKYAVQYHGARTSEEKQRELEEEQIVIEAKMRIQRESETSNQIHSVNNNNNNNYYYNSVSHIVSEINNNYDAVVHGTNLLNSFPNTSFRKEMYIDLEEILTPEAIIWESFQEGASCTIGANGEREIYEVNESTRESMELKEQMLDLCLTFFA